ncbi:MAG: hypothetical protein GX594_17315 [Pirellulaceae bacterium]|nr:hypothetical protein [Pirellulaceae bacterium]
MFALLLPVLAVGHTPPNPSEKVKPKRIYPPSIDGYSSGWRAIEEFDLDGDKCISGDELLKCPGLKAAMGKIDANGDGKITAEEITNRIHAWQKSRLGRMSFACQVTLNGQPLADAEVKFVPEKFLGEAVPVATGKTDDNGMAMIKIPDKLPPGVAPGLYRVEITKDGEKIPAKYNTETIFGQEIAIDALGIQEGVTFDLEY